MHLLNTNGLITAINPRRLPISTPRRVIPLESGDGLIIASTGDYNDFASRLANEPIYGPAILCDSNEECP